MNNNLLIYQMKVGKEIGSNSLCHFSRICSKANREEPKRIMKKNSKYQPP